MVGEENLLDWDLLGIDKRRKLFVATEKTGLEINTEKLEHMFITCEENVEECHNVKVTYTLFEWA